MPPQTGFYWHQLRDMKRPLRDPVATAACLGDGDAFDRSVTDFSQRCADQNERDYQEFVKAIRSGRLEAREGV